MLACHLQVSKMTVVFQDLQQPGNPLNGRKLNSVVSMVAIYYGLRGRKPFLFELRGVAGFMLTVGFAGCSGSVQYSPCNGSPPYLMAVSDEEAEEGHCVEFLAGNSPTPIPRRFCLPISLVERIVREFIERGEKSSAVSW